MIIKLTDGSTLCDSDVYAMRKLTEESCELLGSHTEGEWKTYTGEDAKRIMMMVSELTKDRKDITPDDIAHIEHPGMTFEELLRFFRGE